jgi:sugar phosphate isomerase/epimerase
MTEDAGIIVSSYGSYYRVGHGEPVPFEAVVESAVTLGAPLIRVWAGKQGSDNADAAYWDRVIEDSRTIADLAQQAGIVVAYEYHGNTLTDTNATAMKLLQDVAHDNVKTYWQPPSRPLEENLAGLTAILPWLTNVHVFSWRVVDGQRERMLLDAKTNEWAQYLAQVATTGREHYAMVEFVRDNEPENFLKDAKTLKQWLET